MSGFHCPACGGALVQKDVGDVILFGCGTCRGHWLDNVGSQRVMQGSLPEAARTAARVDAHAPEPRGPGYRDPAPNRREGGRGCPFCGEPLAAARVPRIGIVVDACGTHGTWFDSKELHALAQHYEIQLADAEAEARILSAMIDRATRAERDASRHRGDR